MNYQQLIRRIKHLPKKQGGYVFQHYKIILSYHRPFLQILKSLDNEEWVLEEKESGDWLVYYSERGAKSQVVCYQSEEEACEAYWLRIQARIKR